MNTYTHKILEEDKITATIDGVFMKDKITIHKDVISAQTGKGMIETGMNLTEDGRRLEDQGGSLVIQEGIREVTEIIHLTDRQDIEGITIIIGQETEALVGIANNQENITGAFQTKTYTTKVDQLGEEEQDI